MTKIFYSTCKRYKEFKKPKISYICNEVLPFSSIYNKCGSEDKKN